MAGAQRDRNIKIGSGKKKSTSSSESTGWSRPAEGRRENSPVKKSSPAPNASPRRNEPRRGNTNQQGGRQTNRSSRPQQKSPLMEEQWARVIDHDLASNVVVAVSESKLLLCRLKPKAGIGQLLVTTRIYIGDETSKREHIEQVLGMTNIGRLTNHVKADLPLVVQIFIEENEKHFIAAFFNVAGNMSLKQHAFELLQGVGNKKAMQMVEARGSSGFESLAALNEACNIDAGELLAKRFLSELEDRNIQPRLLDLLLPVKA
jgi:predicted nucleic acid-binding OB-fold protein